MSQSTRSPNRMAGSTLYSGGPNTGELSVTNGGALAATIYSGGALSPGSGFTPGAVKTGDHVVLFSGPGRLNSVIPLASVLSNSGVALTFYDSATAAVSGPLAGGARAILASINAPQGNSGDLSRAGVPIMVGTPFASGLAVCATSGTVGFTVTYTPEVVPQPPVGGA